jgi:high affinity Mn2+ porin
LKEILLAMKLTTVTLASLAALTSPVFAADLPSTLTAPAPPPSGSPWEGFYGGGHTGFAFATSSYATNPAGTPAAGTVGLYGWDGQFGPLEGGFQAGYNHIFSSGLMLGTEAQFSFPNTMRSSLPVTFPANGPTTVSDKTEIFGSLRGRVGYAFGNLLVFGAGGFAYDRDEATATDTNGNVDTGYFWRPGWTAGAGAELLLTPDVSATLEYSYFDFTKSGVTFPIAGERYTSGLNMQTVQLGLNYRFNGNAATPVGSLGILSDSDAKNWSVHAQSTVIGQGMAPFAAAYSGAQSLYNGGEIRDTFSVTGYLGYKAPEGTEFYFNPEPFQGFGLSQTHGLGGFPNLEAQKAGFDYPHYNTSRAFIRQIWGLGGEQEDLADGQNQVAEKVDVSRITLTAGKLSIPDIFDNNDYAHDGRQQFMNWALNDAGAFDYAADQKGYTWGTALELNQKNWAVRTGYFLEPDSANVNNFDTRLGERGQYILELEDRYTVLGSQGKFRLTGWDAQCYCGSFAATLTNPTLMNPVLDPNAPDIAATRKTRSEFGFIANVQQTITDDFGLFSRLSWQSGQTEIMAWTDIDESASAGGVLKGTPWGRPTDAIGLAGVVNGLSANYQKFLAAGGLGVNVGDGALSYRPEEIMETYYSIGLTTWASLTFDYQFIANPGYNLVRGPVSIGAARLHVQF